MLLAAIRLIVAVSTSAAEPTTSSEELTPRVRARWRVSWNSGSSNLIRSTREVRPYRRFSAMRRTRGRSRACAHPAPAWSRER
uniref:hypothetical protein n=1 Tax=Herbidospora sakaeratensis TaxID=564415 RepID=UPI0007820654|nr:hypothetical protein [Herbidospora sakaeratensis]